MNILALATFGPSFAAKDGDSLGTVGEDVADIWVNPNFDIPEIDVSDVLLKPFIESKAVDVKHNRVLVLNLMAVAVLSYTEGKTYRLILPGDGSWKHQYNKGIDRRANLPDHLLSKAGAAKLFKEAESGSESRLRAGLRVEGEDSAYEAPTIYPTAALILTLVEKFEDYLCRNLSVLQSKICDTSNRRFGLSATQQFDGQVLVSDPEAKKQKKEIKRLKRRKHNVQEAQQKVYGNKSKKLQHYFNREQLFQDPEMKAEIEELEFELDEINERVRQVSFALDVKALNECATAYFEKKRMARENAYERFKARYPDGVKHVRCPPIDGAENALSFPASDEMSEVDLALWRTREVTDSVDNVVGSRLDEDILSIKFVNADGCEISKLEWDGVELSSSQGDGIDIGSITWRLGNRSYPLLPSHYSQLTEPTPTIGFLLGSQLFNHLQRIDVIPLNSNLFTMKRVFSGDLKTGGRWYSNFQNWRSYHRGALLINGEPTIELDYAGFHPRLLYHRAGIDMKGDPYEKLGLKDEERDAAKVALQAILNAGNRRGAIGSMKHWEEKCKNGHYEEALYLPEIYYQKGEDGYDCFLEDIKEKLSDIAKDHFFKSPWKHLQYDDARMTGHIINVLGNVGIPVVSVHDSYVVPKRNEQRLRDVMRIAYRKYGRVEFDPVLK